MSTFHPAGRTDLPGTRPSTFSVGPGYFRTLGIPLVRGMGFSTGAWEGNTLVVRTTHIKQGWIRRNGVPQSDRVTTTERFTRHGDILTYVIYIVVRCFSPSRSSAAATS